MSHNKKKHHKKRGARPGQVIGGPMRKPSRDILSILAEVEELVEAGEMREAREMLLVANRVYPDQPEILGAMADIGDEMQDPALLMAAAEGMHRLTPDIPEIVLNLASAYLVGGYPALSLSIWREFLARWPDHPQAHIALANSHALEKTLERDRDRIDLPPDEALEVMALVDQTRRFAYLVRVDDARKAAMRVLDKVPHSPPALNNLSLAYFGAGELDQAIATAMRVLEFEPANIHALANLTHWSVMIGKLDQAREFGVRLKMSKEAAIDRELKIAEALTYLGDDNGVLEAFDAAKAKAKREPMPALLYHLAGVAAMRLGREAEARRRWRRALEIDPDLDPARRNLEDSEAPVGEREGPWGVGFLNWIPAPLFADLAQMAVTTRDPNDEVIQKAVRELARRHPYIEAILPALLDRSDDDGRKFAMMVAGSLGTKESLGALRDFALGQRGTDDIRMDAAEMAMQAGAMPPGNVRMWLDGEWSKTLLMGWDLYDEPTCTHSPKVEKMADKAIVLLRAEKLQEAESVLLEAIKIEPDKPDLHYNMATAYYLEGRNDEARSLIDRIRQEWPDYTFGQVQMALILMDESKLDEAEALLEQAQRQPRMNIEAFGALCKALMRLHLIRLQPDIAENWLNMYRDVLEDDEDVVALAGKIEISKLMVALQGFGRRSRRGKHRDKVSA